MSTIYQKKKKFLLTLKKGFWRFEKEEWTGRHRDTERFEVCGRDVAGSARYTPREGDVGIIEMKD